VSTGDEILPEHLNLPDEGLAQIEQQLQRILANGSTADKQALKQILKNTGLL